jgi:hypothetical protein
MGFGLLLPLRIAQFVFSIVVFWLSVYGMDSLFYQPRKRNVLTEYYSLPLVRCRHFDNLPISDQLPGLCPSLLIHLDDLP